MAYGQLITVTRKTRRQATKVVAALRRRTDPAARRLADNIETILPRLDRVLDQAERRILHGEAVPAGDKILSLFEPHTQIIVRHKAGKPVEFGRKVWLEEVEGGIVSGWRLLDMPGQDTPYLVPSLEAHRLRFGKPPRLVAADRGVFSRSNEIQARQAGVRHVAIPATGQVSPERRHEERQRWFRQGFRFRAGIEGRISVLQRVYGLDRCPNHGEDGLARWIGWGIITANLERIARTLVERATAQPATQPAKAA